MKKIICTLLIFVFAMLFLPGATANTAEEHNATNATANYTAQSNNLCNACHPSYVAAISSTSAITFLPKQHANVDPSLTGACLLCHKGAYDTSTHIVSGYIGYQVTAATCNQAQCHSSTSGLAQSPIDANTHTGNANNAADCTLCHFAKTNTPFPLNNSLSVHSHNFTVEYNYYNYNISGMPTILNGGVGLGMFPYYTCTLTCHKDGSRDKITIGWLQSKHAQSFTGTETMMCARCKSPPNYNVSAPSNAAIAPSDWQGIQCRVCHNMHNVSYSSPIGGFPLAYYNSTASSIAGTPVYEKVPNATVLCQNCHTGTYHDSKFAGTHKDVVGFDCADCHANTSIESDLTQFHIFEVKNTTTGVTGCPVCHNRADHTFQFTSLHIDTNKVDCVACHDQTFTVANATGYSVSSDNTYGIYQDPATGNWTTYVVAHGSPRTWPLHNISKSVNCNKCHNAASVFSGPIAPALTCVDCHPSYASAYTASKHNQALNVNAPACTDCHTGYLPVSGHTTGNKGFIVNETNTCRKSGCHVEGVNGFNESHGIFHPPGADCTQCHFANTTTPFSLDASLYTHDHNLTVEHNFYQYNISGMPLASNGGAGIGMFPYYTCTLTCHSGRHDLEDIASSWLQSKHAQSYEGVGDNNAYCAKCKSPTQYNAAATYPTRFSYNISVSDWQGIQCRVCHNLHRPTYSMSIGGFPLAYYNSTASSLAGYQVYEAVPNATVLCQNCHTGTYHDSKFAGTHKDVVGFDCADCHVNSTFNNESHLFEVKNTTTGVTGCPVCHNIADHTFQFTSTHSIAKVDCVACHDQTFVDRNATNYSVSSDNTYGIYQDPTTGNWTTYVAAHGSPRTWPLHNITKSVLCTKCHGARSVISGGIAPGFGADYTYKSQTTDPLVSGYNLIALSLIPDPVIYANNLLYTTTGGIPGVTKVTRWNSNTQQWESYEYIAASGIYLGSNFAMDGYKAYFVKGNASTVGQTYTFYGRE